MEVTVTTPRVVIGSFYRLLKHECQWCFYKREVTTGGVLCTADKCVKEVENGNDNG